jgi:hypothetical protein
LYLGPGKLKRNVFIQQAPSAENFCAFKLVCGFLLDSPSRHGAGSWVAGTASAVARDLGLTSARLGLRLRGVASAKYARMSATR